MTRRMLIESDEFLSEFEGLDGKTKKDVNAYMDRLSRQNNTGGERLKGNLHGKKTQHVGKYRVLYEDSPEAVIFVRVKPRDKAYED